MSTLPTPRTDQVCEDYKGPLCMIGDVQFIPALFARTLERELTEAKASNLKARADRIRMNTIIHYGEIMPANAKDRGDGLPIGAFDQQAVREDIDKRWGLTPEIEHLAKTPNPETIERDRLPAVAKELAGALEAALKYIPEICRVGTAIYQVSERALATEALAHFRDAANPASSRQPKEEAP